AGRGEIRDNLFDLGIEIIAFFRTIMPLMMMSWSNPGPSGLPHLLSGPNPAPVRAMGALAGFFEAEMRAGRLRHHDPEIVARTFLGGLNHYVFIEVVLRENGALPMPPETFVRGLVHLLLTGVETQPHTR